MLQMSPIASYGQAYISSCQIDCVAPQSFVSQAILCLAEALNDVRSLLRACSKLATPADALMQQLEHCKMH